MVVIPGPVSPAEGAGEAVLADFDLYGFVVGFHGRMVLRGDRRQLRKPTGQSLVSLSDLETELVPWAIWTRKKGCGSAFGYRPWWCHEMNLDERVLFSLRSAGVRLSTGLVTSVGRQLAERRDTQPHLKSV